MRESEEWQRWQGWMRGRIDTRNTKAGGLMYIYNALGTEPSYQQASEIGSKPHRPTISILGGHGGQLERDRVSIKYDTSCFCYIINYKYEDEP